MSRIGKRPVARAQGRHRRRSTGNRVAVKGPKGELTPHPAPRDGAGHGGRRRCTVARPSDEKRHKALHGLTRTLVANMVEGVTKGYQKTLEIQGVGYKAEAKPYGVNLDRRATRTRCTFKAPEGIKITVENNTVVKIEGADKELVGPGGRRDPRRSRPPEPYKGKGIRYQGEQVRRKAGKTGAK